MDYKSLHLHWITNNPKFQPAGLVFDDYHLIMQTLYLKPNVTQSIAKMFFESDRRKLLKNNEAINELKREDIKYLNLKSDKLFITIGFNHQTWSIPSCVKVIENIINLDWIKNATARFELFRENGEHPHCHFLIETTNQMPKSKVLEKIWAAKGIKKVVMKKSFIDFKVAGDHHVDYLAGKKTPEKMQYVAKDMEWRSNNNIPDLFKKIEKK